MFTMNWRRWTRLDLKDQYFGCELEMTGITREQAAQTVAALFGTTARQTHESHTYDPWEVTDGVGKKWRFVYDGSIETTRRECGRQAAARTGLSERADFILSDGLDALPERPDVAAVCGMGGELIADIVARALRRFPGGPPIRFVLQPMTAADALRRFLWDNGFYIAEERYAVAAGKPYAVLTALSAPCIEQENAAAFSAPQNAYTFTSSGEREAFSPSSAPAELVSAPAELVSTLRNSYALTSTENAQRSPRVPLQRNSYTYADLHLGKLRPQTPEYRAYVRRVCAAAEKRLRGRLADGGDPADELLLLREAGEFL